MKLKELHFRNYRLFEQLDIPNLKRVNLIAGKNNTGKTALLEGIRIWAARGDSTVVNHILNNRGEFIRSWESSYKALFYDDGKPNKSIYGTFTMSINDLEVQLQLNSKTKKYETFEVSINQEISHSLNPNSNTDAPHDDEVVYIPYQGQLLQLKKLWDNINLTIQEEDVLAILKETVLPNLKRIGFSKDQFRVLLDSNSDPVPIGSFGDGVLRILTMALALANAKNKILLIDEFELGLHHSIQEKLWELVFKYANDWNIQAFITTHSEDSIRKFYYVASKEQYRNDATFIRLQYDRYNNLEAIKYDVERLESAIELDLEVR